MATQFARPTGFSIIRGEPVPLIVIKPRRRFRMGPTTYKKYLRQSRKLAFPFLASFAVTTPLTFSILCFLDSLTFVPPPSAIWTLAPGRICLLIPSSFLGLFFSAPLVGWIGHQWLGYSYLRLVVFDSLRSGVRPKNSMYFYLGLGAFVFSLLYFLLMCYYQNFTFAKSDHLEIGRPFASMPRVLPYRDIVKINHLPARRPLSGPPEKDHYEFRFVDGTSWSTDYYREPIPADDDFARFVSEKSGVPITVIP